MTEVNLVAIKAVAEQILGVKCTVRALAAPRLHGGVKKGVVEILYDPNAATDRG